MHFEKVSAGRYLSTRESPYMHPTPSLRNFLSLALERILPLKKVQRRLQPNGPISIKPMMCCEKSPRQSPCLWCTAWQIPMKCSLHPLCHTQRVTKMVLWWFPWLRREDPTQTLSPHQGAELPGCLFSVLELGCPQNVQGRKWHLGRRKKNLENKTQDFCMHVSAASAAMRHQQVISIFLFSTSYGQSYSLHLPSSATVFIVSPFHCQ